MAGIITGHDFSAHIFVVTRQEGGCVTRRISAKEWAPGTR